LTITPSLFAREQPSSSTTETVITPVDERERGLGTPSRAPLPTPPERGPKVFFASAKTGEGVSEVFEYIAQRVIRKWAYEEQMDARLLHYRDPSGDDTIRLGLKNIKRQRSMIFGNSNKIPTCCS
jgi:Ras-related protein Rab-7A